MRKNIIFIVFCLMLIVSIASADGFLVPSVDIGPRTDVFSVKYHHVKVDINGQIANTTVDQVFKNETSRQLEATYIFPIPEDAAISKFEMYIDNEPVRGKLLSKEEARRIYEDIVRRRKDPALLEYYGKNMFQARVFPIEPNGEKRIRISYSQLNKRDGGIIKYIYPLNTEKFSAKPLQEVSVTVDIRANRPISNVYSPTHDMSIKYYPDNHITASYEDKNVKPDTDLVLYYSLSQDEMGMDLLTYREKGNDGYFMLLASPRIKAEKKFIPKDVVFVLDRTGSMNGEKIKQAKAALEFCVNSLNPEDRFNIIAFNDDTNIFSKEMLPAVGANQKKALDFIHELAAEGSTDINKVLQTALPMLVNNRRPRYIIFLTDGQPTAGITDTNQILENTAKKNEGGARIFVFGVGNDVNAVFLDRLSYDNRAVSEYVRPNENIEGKVSKFFAKVKNPVLSDIEVMVDGIGSYQIYPSTLPDLFENSQLVITGRFKHASSARIELAGIVAGKRIEYRKSIEIPENDMGFDFVPKIWAARRIAYLSEQIRLKGENSELKDEIVRLSKEFGIMSPYTSFLVLEPNSPDALNFGGAGGAAGPRGPVAFDAMNAAIAKKSMSAPASGGASVAGSQNLNSYKNSAQMQQNRLYDASGNVQSYNNMVQNVGRKVFFNSNNQWIDKDFNTQRTFQINQYSSAFFKLANANKEFAKYFAIGDEVTVVVNGNAIQVVKSGGKDDLNDAELNEILNGTPGVKKSENGGFNWLSAFLLGSIGITIPAAVFKYKRKNI